MERKAWGVGVDPDLKAEFCSLAASVKLKDYEACEEALRAWIAAHGGRPVPKQTDPKGLDKAVKTLRLISQVDPHAYERILENLDIERTYVKKSR